jgi:hypothetical protein
VAQLIFQAFKISLPSRTMHSNIANASPGSLKLMMRGIKSSMRVCWRSILSDFQVAQFTTGSEARGAAAGPSLGRPRAKLVKPAVVGVDHIIAVASGKGGVGKSTTAGRIPFLQRCMQAGGDATVRVCVWKGDWQLELFLNSM